MQRYPFEVRRVFYGLRGIIHDSERMMLCVNGSTSVSQVVQLRLIGPEDSEDQPLPEGLMKIGPGKVGDLICQYSGDGSFFVEPVFFELVNEAIAEFKDIVTTAQSVTK